MTRARSLAPDRSARSAAPIRLVPVLLLILAAPGAAPAQEAVSPPSFQAYSKFDFVPGEKIVALDEFTQDAIGDFPAMWNTDGSGEIVTLAGMTGRWLKLTQPGFFIPESITQLPDNFTVEFDVTVPPTFEGRPLIVAFAELEDVKQPAGWQTASNAFQFSAYPEPTGISSEMGTRQDGDTTSGNSTTTPIAAAKSGQPFHIAVWRQRQRVRVYINQEKVWDVPRGLLASAKLNTIIFSLAEVDGANTYYLTNLRVATGAPDTRNKILTEGKWVTHGILFDINSDRVKPDSYGSLKEIAGVLTENKELRVQIVGHTDSDGDEVANLDLSKRRAASVKAALTREFTIDAGRMDTDGKGESQPVDSNSTPAGKANNRRVEFVRK